MPDEPDWRDRVIGWIARGGVWGIVLPLAIIALFATGVFALDAAGVAFGKGEYVGTGVCLIAAVLAFGIFVVTLIRK